MKTVKDKTVKFIVEKWCDEHKQLFKMFMYDVDEVKQMNDNQMLAFKRGNCIPKSLNIFLEKQYLNKKLEIIRIENMVDEE